jgi:DNA polymerase V
VVIAVVNGEFTVKRLERKGSQLCLVAENPSYPPLFIGPGCEFEIRGVVTCVLHQV